MAPVLSSSSFSRQALVAATCITAASSMVSSFTPPIPALVVPSSRAVAYNRFHDTSRMMVQVNGGLGENQVKEEKQQSTAESSTEWWSNYDLPNASIAEQTRPDFEILSTTLSESNRPLIYLDSAATSQKPKAVLEALDYYYEHQNSNVHRGAHTLSRDATAAYEGARDKIAAFVNANSRNEVIFTSGATESINLVVQSYGRAKLQKGDEIVLTEMEHHSNLVPWQMLADTIGVVLKFCPMDRATGGVDQAQFEALLSDKTKLVAFQHVSNVAGCVNPVVDMVKMVREKAHPTAKVLVDACQSVPHMPVDVQALGSDFLAASGHKMCGPTGIGFLWGKEDVLNDMPPFMGGGEMIDQVTLEGSTFVPAPGRFEAGTPAIAQAIGLGAAVDYLQAIGMEKIETYEHELADYLYKRMEEVDGVKIVGPPSGVTRAALCAFVCDDVHPSDLSSFLDMEGVAIRAGHHCCQPLHQSLGYSHSARASLYFYNTKHDVDEFIKHLKSTISFFSGLDGKGEGDAASEEDDFVPFV